MWYFIVLTGAVILGGYFAFRYLSIRYAFQKLTEELEEIQKDLSQNHLLHMPIPNRHMGKLLSSFNTLLEEIRRERQNYQKREKNFQHQIESISHDLRTPLTVILGYLKFIRTSEHAWVQEEKELEEILDILEQKAESMNGLVSQFYDFSRLNGGEYAITLDKVDFSRTLRESLLGNYQILEKSELQLTTDLPEGPVWGIGDAAALERIFLNLFQNAGRYADTYLHIAIKEEEKQIKISFVNDTKKLTKEEAPHLFERFYRQDSSRNQGGTGLGLTVAKGLAEQMGGTLTAKIWEEGGMEKSLVICFSLCLKR